MMAEPERDCQRDGTTDQAHRVDRDDRDVPEACDAAVANGRRAVS